MFASKDRYHCIAFTDVKVARSVENLRHIDLVVEK